MTSSTTTGTGGVAREDQQRARADRGLRSSASALASQRDKLPSPPRRRRPAMAALAVLLIVGGAALAGLLAVRLDERVPVLVADQNITVGEKIQPSMLAQASVATEDVQLIPADKAELVLGTYATTNISAGQLLDPAMVAASDPIEDDQAVVGVPLAAGRVPPGLASGDLVRVVRIGKGDAPPVPLATALVLRTRGSSSGSLAGGGGSAIGTLLIPRAATDAIVDAAGTDQLGLALLQSGVSMDDVDLQTLGE